MPAGRPWLRDFLHSLSLSASLAMSVDRSITTGLSQTLTLTLFILSADLAMNAVLSRLSSIVRFPSWGSWHHREHETDFHPTRRCWHCWESVRGVGGSWSGLAASHSLNPGAPPGLLPSAQCHTPLMSTTPQSVLCACFGPTAVQNPPMRLRNEVEVPRFSLRRSINFPRGHFRQIPPVSSGHRVQAPRRQHHTPFLVVVSPVDCLAHPYVPKFRTAFQRNEHLVG
jgi:hypothetical protein